MLTTPTKLTSSKCICLTQLLRRARYLVVLLPMLSFASDLPTPAANVKSSGIENLSPEIRQLLAQEMISIQAGIIAIVPAYAAGDIQQVASISRSIKEGYILRQALSPAQRQELADKLPPAFVRLDENFHYYAGMLEVAAINSKYELIGFYLAKLMDACASCHAEHARHKFPAFENNKQAESHSH